MNMKEQLIKCKMLEKKDNEIPQIFKMFHYTQKIFFF